MRRASSERKEKERRAKCVERRAKEKRKSVGRNASGVEREDSQATA